MAETKADLEKIVKLIKEYFELLDSPWAADHAKAEALAAEIRAKLS